MYKISLDDVLSSILFPPGFVWGAATSAYQIEGAADTDGRGASIWDTFAKQPGAILDASSGQVACEHYARLEQDLDLLQQLGLPAYRFSIAWPRVQPLGQGAWNEAGLAFYDRLIDGLTARGIAAHLTLYHWDLPQALQDAGGWGERSTAYHFAEYARVIATRYGQRVASIATHNEPWVVATLGHEKGIFAPGLKNRKLATQVSHHLLLSHGLALQTMRSLDLPAELGIVLNQAPIHPATSSAADAASARLDDGLLVRWYMDPLLRGCYPDDVLHHLGDDAPHIESGDMALISAPIDFLGINYYTRSRASANGDAPPPATVHGFTAMDWEVYPAGLPELLRRLARDYRLPPVYITENGAAYDDQPERAPDGSACVHDSARTRYLQMHIAALHEAIVAGVRVRGYFAWSLLDNFEWAFGYSKRFGIVYVDYATQQRIPKDSALWYRSFIAEQQRAQALAARRGQIGRSLLGQGEVGPGTASVAESQPQPQLQPQTQPRPQSQQQSQSQPQSQPLSQPLPQPLPA
jgi:beta-glucosidase